MKNDIVKAVKTEIDRIVDPETAEVLEVETKYIQILINPDEFALVYAGLWNVLLEQPLSKSDIDLFGYLIQHYADGTMFSIPTQMKELLAKKTGKSASSYSNSVRHLVKYRLIIPIAPNSRTYTINPRYAFKGSSGDRNRAVIELVKKCKDC